MGRVFTFLFFLLLLRPLPGFCWTKVLEGSHSVLFMIRNPKGVTPFPDLFSSSFSQKTIPISGKEMLVFVSVNLNGIQAMDPYPLPSHFLEGEAKRYTVPGKGIQSDDPEISRLAGELVRGSSSLFDAVTRIISWVADNISYDGGQLKADALEVLRSGRGICHGISLLCVALLRAAGIPSRPAAAFIPEGAPWVGPGVGMDVRAHVFVEVLSPTLGWIMYDPQESYHFVDPYHIYMYPLDGPRNRDLYEMATDPETRTEVLMDLDRTIAVDLLPYPEKREMVAQRVGMERFASALVLDIRNEEGIPVGGAVATMRMGEETWTFRANDAGLGSIVGVRPGSYRVTVGGEGYADGDISVMLGEKELVWVRVVLRKGARVMVALEDMNGKRITAPGFVYLVRDGERIGYPTSADGTKVLFLPLGRHRVIAKADGFVEREVDVEIKDLGDRELRIRLERAGLLELRVLSQNGAPVPKAEVMVRFGDIGLAYKTGEDGVLKLPLLPGRYEIKVSALGYAGYEGEAWIEAGRDKRLEVVLRPAASGLRVWVIDAMSSAPIPFAKVVLWRDGVGEARQVDKSGSLELSLPPGRYRISGRADGYVETEVEVSVPTSGLAEAHIRLPKGVLVKGKVYGADGKPLSSGFIYVWVGGKGKGYRIGSDGSYSLSLLPGTHKITVNWGDSSFWEGEIDVGEGEGVVVRDIRIIERGGF
jgi:hypothetical protein